MKVILEFNLPEDEELYDLHRMGAELQFAISEYSNWLRAIVKHGEPEKYDAAACQEKLYEFLSGREIML